MTTSTLARTTEVPPEIPTPSVPRHRRARHRRPQWPTAVSLSLYVAAGAFAYLPAWRTGAGQTVHGCGCSDQAMNAWFLNWGAFALLHLHNPFFSWWLNVPQGVNLMVNTGMPVLAFLGAPITWLFGAVATYNVLLFLAFPVSAGAAYLLLRRWTRHAFPAFVGGLVYGFSPYLVGQDNSHLHLSFVPIPPLVLLVLDEIVVRQRGSARVWGAALGLLAAVQLGISTEILATTALMAVIGMVVLALLRPRDVVARLPHAGRALVPAIAVFAVLAAYPLWWMLLGPQHTVGPPQGVYGLAYRADLLGPLLPTSNQLITLGSLTTRANLFSVDSLENGSYLGLPLILLLAGVTAACRRRGAVAFFAIMAVVAFVLSLGTTLTVDNHSLGVPLPFTLIAKIPLLDGILANRLSLYVVLFSAIVLATGIDAFLARYAGSWRSTAAGGSVLVVALLPLVPAFPYSNLVPAGVPAYFTSAAVHRIPSGTVVLSYPVATPAASQFQLWQAASGMRFRLPVGYAIVPGTDRAPEFFDWNLTSQTLLDVYEGHVPAETPALRQQLRAQWRSWEVRTVLYAPLGTDPKAAYQFLEWALGRPATPAVGGIRAWYDPFGAPR